MLSPLSYLDQVFDHSNNTSNPALAIFLVTVTKYQRKATTRREGLGWYFEGTVHHDGKVWQPGWPQLWYWEPHAAGHIAYAVKEQT